MTKYGDDRTSEEIAICVKAYVDAVKAGGTKKEIKKDVFLFRAIKQLTARNEGSVARRMANISHVLIESGGEPVLGWKGLANVGPTNTVRIQDELRKHGLI